MVVLGLLSVRPIAFDNHQDLEFRDPADVRAVQEKLLQQHVAYCAAQSPFYRRALTGVSLGGGAMLDRLGSLPLTDKADLEAHNDDFLAVPPTQIVDIVMSSGTTGRPTRVMYSQRDLERLAYNEHLSFEGCGLTAEDVVLLTCTIDRCFVAGLAYYLGVRSIGAAAIRNGHGTLESHQEVIRQMRPTAIVGVPTFLRKLGQFLQAGGVEPSRSGVKKLVCIGEPLRDRDMGFLRLGSDLERLWGARAYSTYASSETITTFCECTAQQGGHLHPSLAVVEILDDDGRPVPSGSAGEVVVTPLAIEGMPLIRFRTGDVSFLRDEPCPCGRTSPRLGPIIGRKKQMLKVRGTTLYPQAVYSVLEETPGMSEYYVEATSEEDLSDHIRVHVALKDGGAGVAEIEARLQARLRVKPEVVLEAEDAIRQQVYTPRSRKPVRFVDGRKRT